MDPVRFDQIAKSLAGRRSRRQVIARLGGVALTAISGSCRFPGMALAQDATPAAAALETRPVFPPIPVSQTLAPLFPAPDLYPVVGFDEGEIIPILGPSQGVGLEEAFGLPEATPTNGEDLEDLFGPPGEFAEVVAITDGNVVSIIDFPISEFAPGPPSPPPPPPPPLPTGSAVTPTPSPVIAMTPTPVIAATPTSEEGPCGVDDSQDVELYNPNKPGTLGVPKMFVDEHQPPVGNIQWNWGLHLRYPDEEGTVNGVRWCSGTLIAGDLFLTAGHCFEPDFGTWITPRVNGVPIGRPEIARNLRVNFNYQWGPDGPRPEKPVAIVDLLEDRLGDRDYAIVQLEQDPGPPFLPARIAVKDAPQGSTICMMGHPNQLPKRIAAGHASEYQGPRLYYDDLDTAGGASGAGLLTNEGFLCGIHTNGGCGEQSGQNHGYRIEALLEVSPILRSLVEA